MPASGGVVRGEYNNTFRPAGRFGRLQGLRFPAGSHCLA